MKKLYIFWIALLHFSFGFSQKQGNIWYFGNYAGLDFNNGTPQPLFDSQSMAEEGVSTIADANGNLLFYTDGMTIYNKNHAPMQNGLGLLGSTTSAQSALIVAKPGSDSIYYVFTTYYQSEPGGLHYNEIDMSANNGLGAVTVKNMQLMPVCTEHLTALFHYNGTDIWVLTHDSVSDNFKAFLVTPQGVNTTPVTSLSGLPVSNTGFTRLEVSIGYLKASPSGQQLAIATYAFGLRLIDFNNQTGQAGGGITLASDNQTWYGVEFSPSGKLLYAGADGDGRMVQFNLEAENIAASAVDLLPADAPLAGAFQRAPDGKIYCAQWQSPNLTVINNPDILGTGCNAVLEGIDLGGRQAMGGLPYAIWPNRLEIQNQVLCAEANSRFSFLSDWEYTGFEWDFGDGNTSTEKNPVHHFTATGTYTVTLTATRPGTRRVVQGTVTVIPKPEAQQPPNLFLCDDESNDGSEVFDIAQQFLPIISGLPSDNNYLVSYHLSQEDADADANPIIHGNYANIANPQTIYVRLEITGSDCYDTTSFNLEVYTNPLTDMPDTFGICEDSSVTITAPAGMESYEWSTGATTREVQIFATGTVTLTVVRKTGDTECRFTKTFTVATSQPPVIAAINTSDWTYNNNTIEVLMAGNGNFEYSIDGSSYQSSNSFTNLEAGLYTVYVRDPNGCGTATGKVLLLMYPNFFTPNNDGFHDTWRIEYGFLEPNLQVYIYDRYGKLLTAFNGKSKGWDGRYNGETLPSTDYWFVVQRQDGREHKGHFSMLR